MSESAAATTRLGRGARATCLAFLVSMGCDGSKGSGAGVPACGSFNACGGSVVGAWKYPPTIECGPGSTTDPTPPTPIPCTGYTKTGDVQLTGSVTFSADGTWRTSMVFDGAYQIAYPVGCAGISTCPASVSEPGVSMTCSETPPGTCHCEYVFDNYSATSQGGTYTTSGGKLTTVEASDGAEDTVDYCVQGNTLRIHAIDASTGEPMTVALTRQ